jgi:hypothetical protein
VKVKLFTGLHQPSDARHFDAAFISINRLRRRKRAFSVGDWVMDSGAFTEVSTHGRYRSSVQEYADEIIRWKSSGNLLAAVSQDYMCESFILDKTGLDIQDHQRLTIERYDDLLETNTGVYIMPVLQGFHPKDYVRHVEMYGYRLQHGQWVGVGSVCKRNGNPRAIEDVLLAIHGIRPDLKLHGFGIKSTALSSGLVQELLFSCDSMAWSFSARKQGRNANDWREAKRWTERISCRPSQIPLFIPESL